MQNICVRNSAMKMHVKGIIWKYAYYMLSCQELHQKIDTTLEVLGCGFRCFWT